MEESRLEDIVVEERKLGDREVALKFWPRDHNFGVLLLSPALSQS
jgi:hypothetical protein